MQVYVVWKMPEHICMGEFYDLDTAKDFVAYQATLGNDYKITYHDASEDYSGTVFSSLLYLVKTIGSAVHSMTVFLLNILRAVWATIEKAALLSGRQEDMPVLCFLMYHMKFWRENQN